VRARGGRRLSCFQLQPAGHALAVLEASAIGASVFTEAEGTDAVAAGVADVSGPIGGELLSAALTGDKHGVYGVLWG